MMPRVTVLVPTYNREESLPRCLESVLAQSYGDWQLIVGDNASEDRTPDIIASLRDPRVRLVRRDQNVGYVRNHNLLLDEVDSEFVAFLHSDDWWEPHYLRQMVKLLDDAPSALMAVSAARLVFDDGRTQVERLEKPLRERLVLPSREAAALFVRRWNYVTPSDVVARRSLYRRFPAYDERFPASIDWLMWIRAASAAPVAVCNEPLANNRRQAASVTGQSQRAHAWAREHVVLADLVASEWRQQGEPYPGAGRELKAMTTLRLAHRAFQQVLEGDRAGAVQVSRHATASCPSLPWRASALAWHLFLRVAPVAILRFMRWVATRAGTALLGRWPIRRSGTETNGDVSRTGYLSWSLRSLVAAAAEHDGEVGG